MAKSIDGPTISIEELKQRYLFHYARSQQLQERWILGLAVANGAALTALSAKTIDLMSKAPEKATLSLVGLLYPSLWFFVIGFLAVGISAVQEMLQVHRSAAACHESVGIRQRDPNTTTIDQHRTAGIREWLFELISGCFFAMGLAYPVAVLATRYVKHGYFTW